MQNNKLMPYYPQLKNDYLTADERARTVIVIQIAVFNAHKKDKFYLLPSMEND